MAKVLYARGSDGLVSIHEEGADYTNPLANLSAFYFNSLLDYIDIVKMYGGTLSLPARSKGTMLDTVYNIGSHGLGFQPMVLGVIMNGGQQICGDTVVFAAGFSSYRSITAGSDGTNVYIRETCFLPAAGYDAPALTIPYTLFLLGNPAL